MAIRSLHSLTLPYSNVTAQFKNSSSAARPQQVNQFYGTASGQSTVVQPPSSDTFQATLSADVPPSGPFSVRPLGAFSIAWNLVDFLINNDEASTNRSNGRSYAPDEEIGR
jgi:hypothetical protein